MQALRILKRPEELLTQSGLGLVAEVVVQPREYDHEVVAGVCGLRDHRREVRGLSGLNVSDDQAVPREGSLSLRVAQVVDHAR